MAGPVVSAVQMDCGKLVAIWRSHRRMNRQTDRALAEGTAAVMGFVTGQLAEGSSTAWALL